MTWTAQDKAAHVLFSVSIAGSEAITPQEPEEEPDVAPKMKGDGRQMATQISRVRQACRQPE